MQGQRCQEFLKPFFQTNSSKSQATAWADSGKSRRKLKAWKSLQTPPQPTSDSLHRWLDIEMQQDAIFISGKAQESRHTTRGTGSVSLLAVKSIRVSSLPVQKAPRNPMPCRWEMLDGVSPFPWGICAAGPLNRGSSWSQKREKIGTNKN